MNLVSTKANNTVGALGQLDAVTDWDAMAIELNTAVQSSAQTLETGVTNQLAQAAMIAGASAESFTENSPGANVANLTPITGTNGLQLPTSAAAAGGSAYSLMNGFIASFNHTVASTTNSTTGFTVQIGQNTGAYLAGQYLVQIGGAAIPVGAIFGYTRIRYNTSAGYWELLSSDGFNKINQQNPVNYIKNGTFQVSLINNQSSVTINATSTDTFVYDKWRYQVTALGGITHTTQQMKMSPGNADELVCLNEGCQTYMRQTPSAAGSGFATSDYFRWHNYIRHGAVNLCGGRSVTVTFKARSSIAGKLLGVAGEQYYGTGGSPSANTIVQGNYVTLTSTFAKYSVTLTTTSLSGITLGTNYTPTDDALIIDFFYQWGATIGTNYLNYGSPETFRATGTIDITEIVVTPTYCPLNYMPIPYEKEIKEIQTDQYNIDQQFLGGTTYNTVPLNVTATNGTLVRAWFRVYQTLDGIFHLNFNLTMTFSPSGVTTITIAGVTFKSGTNNNQSVTWATSGGATAGFAYATANAGTITLAITSPGGNISVGGDVELNSLPTWVTQF